MIKSLHKKVLEICIFTILVSSGTTTIFANLPDTCSRYVAIGSRIKSPECTQDGAARASASNEKSESKEDFLSLLTNYLKALFG